MKSEGAGKSGDKTSNSNPAKPEGKAVSPKPRAATPRRTAKPAARKTVAEPKAEAPQKATRPRAGQKGAARHVPRRAEARKPEAPEAAVPKAAVPKGGAPKAGPKKKAALSEEEQIEAAKYLPRDVPKRLFEEERFVFPETYGVTRVRLLVKDPEWLFAHWDVDPKTLAAVKGEVGERAMALSRLTLRIADPDNGGHKTILLPAGTKSWYVRADARRARAYRAELGLTLPSGEFKPLAESNTVATPRVGPSPETAKERRRIGKPPAPPMPEAAEGASSSRAASVASKAAARKREPWRPSPARLDGAREMGGDAGDKARSVEAPERAGASDAFRPAGRSDVPRR